MPTRPPEALPAARRCRVFLAFLAVAVQAAPARAGDDQDSAAAVLATGSGPLETSIEVQKLVAEEGAGGVTVRHFVAASRLEAGEQVYYTIKVTNPGQEPVHDVVVTKRLPYGVDYVPGSAVGPACEVQLSADGGTKFIPARGKGTYTHLRWIFRYPLAPGATSLLRFRAVFL